MDHEKGNEEKKKKKAVGIQPNNKLKQFHIRL